MKILAVDVFKKSCRANWLMKCTKCGIEMMRVGIGSISSGTAIAEYECPACHSRVQGKIEKPEM